MSDFVVTVTCPSRRGIVAAIANFLADRGANITDSAQFDDPQTGKFFMRIRFASETGTPLTAFEEDFGEIAAAFHMQAAFHDPDLRPKVMIMVSRFGHCLNDLLYRWRIGALPIDIVGVISNHLDYQKVVVNHDIAFHHIKVSADHQLGQGASPPARSHRTSSSVPTL